MEEEIEEAVEQIMGTVTSHKLAGTGVEQESTASFYEGIAQQCEERASLIREEMG